MKKIFLALLFIMFFAPNVLAIYDDNFRECLTQKIYSDCEKNLTWTAETVLFPDGSSVIKNGEILTMDKIRKIIDFAEMQNNDFQMIGFSVEDYPERFHCDNYYLRVNNNKYFWRGVEVTCPTSITKNYNENITLEISIISFSIIGIGITFLGIKYIKKKKK